MKDSVYMEIQHTIYGANYKRHSGKHTLQKNKRLSIVVWPKFEYRWSGYLQMPSTTSSSMTVKKVRKMVLAMLVKFIA